MAENHWTVGGTSGLDEAGLAYVGTGVRTILKVFGLTEERVSAVLDHLTPTQLYAVNAVVKVAPGAIAYAFAKLPKSIFLGFKNPELVSKAIARALEEFAEKIEEMVKNHGSVEKAPKAVREAAVVTSISAGLGLKGMSLKSDGVCFHRPTCLIVTTVLKAEHRPPRKGKDGVEIPGSSNSKVFDIDLESAQEQGQKPCSACLAVLLFDAKAASVEKPKEEAKPVVPENKPVSFAELLLEFFKKEPENRARWHVALKALSKEEYEEVTKHLPYIDTADELELLLPALEARGRDLEFALRTMRDFNQKVRIGLEAAELAEKGQKAAEKLDAKVVGPLVDWLDGRPAKRVASYAGGWAICGIIVLLLGLLSAGWATMFGSLMTALVGLSVGIIAGLACGVLHHYASKRADRVESSNNSNSYEWRLLELPFALVAKVYRRAIATCRRSIRRLAMIFGLPLGLALIFSHLMWDEAVRWTAFGAVVMTVVLSFLILKDLAEIMVIGKAGAALGGKAELVTMEQFIESKGWLFSFTAWYCGAYWWVFCHPYISPIGLGVIALASAFFAYVRLTPWFSNSYFRPVIYGLALVVLGYSLFEISFPPTASRLSYYVYELTGIDMSPKDSSQIMLTRRLLIEQKRIHDDAVENHDGVLHTDWLKKRDAVITKKLEALSKGGNAWWVEQNMKAGQKESADKEVRKEPQTAPLGLIPKDEADDILRELEAAKAL